MDVYTRRAFLYAAIVTLGGFVFGLDAAVISGTVRYITVEFGLSDLEVGAVVSAPGFGVLFALIVAGAICESVGRKKTLILVAALYTVSALLSAIATSYEMLVGARFIGGLAFASLSIASMYIGEIAPSSQRGKLVSMNQIMIVVGLTAAYFSNYFLIEFMAESPDVWRWMLGMEIVPALIWMLLLFVVPQSPRWLLCKGKKGAAKAQLLKLVGPQRIEQEFEDLVQSKMGEKGAHLSLGKQFKAMFEKHYRKAVLIGIVFAFVQPLTGVNPILFYAPMVFEQTGIGTNASFASTLIIGVVSFLFTALAIVLVDRLGRRPLVNSGLVASGICLLLCFFAFKQATYTFTEESIENLNNAVPELSFDRLQGQTFNSDTSFKAAVSETIGHDVFKANESVIIQNTISMNGTLVLIGIVGFIAAFHVSIGPLMWVVFSEIVPIQIRGVAIPTFAMVCSIISFLMQFFFPWQLSNFGAADVFLSYALASGLGLLLLYKMLPETKNKSIEEVDEMLHSAPQPS
ncbi:MAG: hypothetical protein Alis3KO_28880 [Aliiglaciecola sp.]